MYLEKKCIIYFNQGIISCGPRIKDIKYRTICYLARTWIKAKLSSNICIIVPTSFSVPGRIFHTDDIEKCRIFLGGGGDDIWLVVMYIELQIKVHNTQ